MVIHTNTPKIEIVNSEGEPVDFQISPIINPTDLTLETARYKVYFRTEIAAVTVTSLFVRRTASIKPSAVPQITAQRIQWPSTFLGKNVADSLSGIVQNIFLFFLNPKMTCNI